MSLIPSESYSFPDHFTSTVTPSRRPKQEKPEPNKIHKRPAIVALPDPEPEPEPIIAAEPKIEPEVLPEIWEPEVPEVKAAPPPPLPKPNPAVRRAHAPPPRIPEVPIKKIALPPGLKPKVRWNNRAPAMDPTTNRNGNNGNGNHSNGSGNGVAETPIAPFLPAQNVIPMKAARLAQAPAPRPLQPAIQRQVIPHALVPAPPPKKPAAAPIQMRPAQPRPAPAPLKPAPPAAANPQADFFEMFAEDGYEAANRHRREMKFRRFLACEGAALLVLLPLVILGLTLDITGPTLRWIMNILTIAAAIAAVVIPIVFYAFTPTLPEIER